MREDIFVDVREYIAILLRRWPLLIIPALLAAALGVVTYSTPAPQYAVGMRFIVSQQPTAASNLSEEERSYTWITSQYVVNAMVDWATASDFANRLSAEVAREGFDVDPEDILDNIEVGTYRSQLTVNLFNPDEETLEALARATGTVLNRDNVEAVPHLLGSPAIIQRLDFVDVEDISVGSSLPMAVIIRFVVGLGAGAGLAFFLDYMDPKLRSGYQVTLLDIPLIGSIPKE